MKSKHKCSLLRDSISHLPKLLPNSSWYEQWMRKINKLFLVSINHPEVFSCLKSSTAIEKESKRQVNAKNFIIHPLSEFRKYWNIIVFIAMFLHTIFTAFSIGFYVDMEDHHNMLLTVTDLMMCFILWIEIVISFRTGYIISETDEIFIDPKSIAMKYLRNFIPDFICALPHAFIMMWIIEDKGSTINGYSVIYMLFLFVLSIYRFNRILFYYSSIPIILRVSEKTSSIIVICLRTFYLWHCTACIRQLIPLYVVNNPVFENNWYEQETVPKFRVKKIVQTSDFQDIENIILNDLKDLFANYTILNKYSRTMMITLKLALQSGYSRETADSTLNMLMTSFIIFGGWIYATYVLILVSNIIVAMRVSENKFQDMMLEIEVYADANRLSRQLREKMKTFIERKYQKHYFNEEAIKQSTAVCLRKEIMMHSCSNLVAKVPLFKQMPTIMIENIISCLEFEIYFPNDVIIEANTLGDSMYFIAFGTAVILSSKGKYLQVLCDGSHFGEIALLIKGQKRTATVKALEICEVYKLSHRDFRKVVEPHSDILKLIEEIARERIRITHQYEHAESKKSRITQHFKCTI